MQQDGKTLNWIELLPMALEKRKKERRKKPLFLGVRRWEEENRTECCDVFSWVKSFSDWWSLCQISAIEMRLLPLHCTTLRIEISLCRGVKIWSKKVVIIITGYYYYEIEFFWKARISWKTKEMTSLLIAFSAIDVKGSLAPIFIILKIA